MTVYQNLMGQIESEGLLFNVAEDQVITASGIVIEGKKALINTANEKVMGIVSTGYRTVPNEEIFSNFCQAIEDSSIDAEGAHVNIRRTESGSRAMVDFVFPNEQFTVNGDDSKTQLQICALNSFDGSLRYITKAGGLRIKCLNGQVLGNIAASYSSAHTAGLNVEAGAKKVIEMLDQFNSAKEYWGELMQTRVSDAQVISVLLHFLELTPDSEFQSNKRYQRVWEIWRGYRAEMGSNAYALYNTMTDYVTHRKPRNADTAVRAMANGRERINKAMATFG